MIPISISLSRTANDFHKNLKEAIAKTDKLFNDLSQMIEDGEYGDAAAFVQQHSEKLGSKLSKLVIEFNELSEIGPVDILQRREQEILTMIKEQLDGSV